MASTASAPEADLNLNGLASGQGENSQNFFVTTSPSTLRSSIISYVTADPLERLPPLLELQKLLHSLSPHVPLLQNKGSFRSWPF